VLDSSLVHHAWNNAVPARLEILPGDSVEFECRDARDGAINRTTTAGDLAGVPFKGHPLTGPVRIRGAQRGDVLQVDVVELATGDLGWTAFFPGRGLLPEDFPDPYLRLWDLSGSHAELRAGIRIPIQPFLGVMGVAPAEAGDHSTMPPGPNGGNLDVKQLTVGSTLFLPVAVDGALFSCGDGHAAQGDGEVCTTAIETTMRATLRFSLIRSRTLNVPELETTVTSSAGRYHVTLGISPDLMDASKQAVRGMIAYVVDTWDLSREDAYVLCSVAVDLKISEVVDTPNWVVSAHLPMAVMG
jgi:acetamidase/formamidase